METIEYNELGQWEVLEKGESTSFKKEETREERNARMDALKAKSKITREAIQRDIDEHDKKMKLPKEERDAQTIAERNKRMAPIDAHYAKKNTELVKYNELGQWTLEKGDVVAFQKPQTSTQQHNAGYHSNKIKEIREDMDRHSAYDMGLAKRPKGYKFPTSEEETKMRSDLDMHHKEFKKITGKDHPAE